MNTATAQIIQFPVKEAKKPAKNTKLQSMRDDRKFSNVLDHEAVEPIKDVADIEAAKQYLLSQEPRWRANPTNLRNYMMFVININNGCRISDLLRLKIGDVLINDHIQDQVFITETKTGKSRPIFFGPNSKGAIKQYLEALPCYQLSDYLFSSRKTNHGQSQPIGRIQAWRIVSDMGKAISEGRDKQLHLGTHSMRKTFGYQRISNDPDNQLIVAQISEIYNHSSLATTYHYLGMDVETKREICVSNEL